MPNGKAPHFANALKRTAQAYPAAKTLHLLMDSLNTHFEKSLTDRLGIAQGRMGALQPALHAQTAAG
jgi:hypothetical protein